MKSRRVNKTQIRTVLTAGGVLSYELTRKKVKNLNLRITREGRIKVSAPMEVPLPYLDEFVRDKEAFIRKALERIEQQPQETTEQFVWESGKKLQILGRAVPLVIEEGMKEGVRLRENTLIMTVKPENGTARKEYLWQNWQKGFAKEIFSERLPLMEALVEPFGIRSGSWSVRRMKSRWGSCQPSTGKIVLNTRLTEAPIEAIDYVILHELAHIRYPNHQKEFYDFIAQFMPDWKARKEMLKKIL